MTVHPLDPVVLTRDLPAHGLRRGDLGAVVEIYVPIRSAWSSSRPRAEPKRWLRFVLTIFARSLMTSSFPSVPSIPATGAMANTVC